MEKQAVYERVGGNIRRVREERELNQSDLADIIGCARTSITHLETGRQGIQIHQLLQIAAALGVEPSDLLDIGNDWKLSHSLRNDAVEDLPGNLAAIVSNLQLRISR